MLVIGHKRPVIPQAHARTRAARESEKVAAPEITFGSIAVLFDANSELKSDALKIDPFQAICRERILFCMRRGCLFANRLVITREAGEAERARKFSMPAMIEVREVIEVSVCRERIKLRYIFISFEFKFPDPVFVMPQAEIQISNETVQLAHPAFEVKTMAPLFQIFQINFVSFRRNPMAAEVHRIIECQPSLARKPTCAATKVKAARIRVPDVSNRRAIVAGSLGTPICEQHHV